MLSLKTNIQELAENNPTPFDDYELTLYTKQYSDSRCFLPDTVSENATVDINEVIGHAQGYPEMSWSFMLAGLKRINKACDDLVKTPEYYFLNEKKKNWSFIEIEGDYFISSGKHRTTVFKYFTHFNPDFFGDEPTMKGVRVTHKNINYTLEYNIKQIEQLLAQKNLEHIKFGVRGSCRDLPAKYYLANTKRSIGYSFFDESELPKVFELLHTDSPLARFSGQGLGRFLRTSAVFPW